MVMNKKRFGVELFCPVLSEHDVKIALSTCYAAKTRAPSARALRDTGLGEQIWRVFHDRDLGRGLAGARKVWRLLKREDVEEQFGPIARCTVERLMRDIGLQCMRRGPKRVRTTIRDGTAKGAADLAGRDFTASAPNRLWSWTSPTCRRGLGWRSPRW